MSNQSTFSIRMDADLKKQFDALCSDFGMTASTAINVFAKAVVREQKIPFEIACSRRTVAAEGLQAFMNLREQAEQNGLTDMTIEEINAEIASARANQS